MRKYLYAITFLAVSIPSLAQFDGPTIVAVNSTHTYTYYPYGSSPLVSPNWQVAGGVVMSEWMDGDASSGYAYHANIKWTVNGLQSVMIRDGGMGLEMIMVDVCGTPSIPSATAASSVATNSFTANWSTASNASSYRLYVATNSTFTSFVSGYNGLNVAGTSRSVTGLTPGVTYYYRVRASNCLGSLSNNSNSVSIATLLGAPTATPATSVTATSFTANWGAVSGASGYRLDVSTSSSFSSFVSGYNNLSVTTTNRSVTGLSAGTTYYYRVRAVNGSGTSGNSGTIGVLTLPAVPSGIGASNITATSFTANWGGVSSSTGYRLDVSTSSSFSSFVSGYNNLSVTTTNRSVTGLSAGTTYYYRVRAVNGSGTSGNSGTISVLTGPAAPSASAASSIAGTSFTANWGGVSTATSYRLDVSTSSSFSSFVSGYNNLSVTTTNRSVTGVNAGTTYYYRVRAVNGSGTSGNSGTISVLTGPAAPSASAASSITGTSFTANWGSVSTATSYRLDVSASSSFSTFASGYNNLSVTTTNRSVTGLSAGTTYYYRVRAVNGSGTSGNSGTISVLTLPDAPSASAASSITANSFTTNWSSVSSATGYLLDVSTSSSFSSFVSGYNNLSVTTTNRSVTGLSAGTTYYYRVRAVNGSGTSGNSGTISLLTLPAAPSANAASSITASSFTANWSSVSSATGYLLDVSTSSSFSSFVSGYDNLSVTTTNHSVTGLDAGTIYYYRVRSVNASGISGNSNTTTVLTLSEAPVPDAATNITATSFTASWQIVASATGYRLDVSQTSTFSSFVIGYQDLFVSTTSQNVSGLNPGTTYYYRVRAVNESGPSENSIVILVIGAPVTNPATNITATSFTAGWNNIEAATGYQLDVSLSNTFLTFVSGYNDLAVSSTSQVVSGLSPGTTYYCRVRSVNSNGTSGNSNIVAVLTVPAAPVANAASGISASAFTANWGAAASATGYRLDVSTSSSFSGFVAGYNNLSVSSGSQNVTGVNAGTTYYYRVRAVNASGISASSSSATVITVPPPPVAQEASNQASTSFTANWESTSSATSYLLDVSSSNSFSNFIPGYNGLSVSATSEAVTGLSQKTVYYYRVRAVNGSGTSGYSSGITVETDNFVPLYNGMITSVRWRTDEPFATTGGDLSGMYLYSYDDKYQVRMASWAEPDHALSTFTMAGDKYKVFNPDYDANGNIRKLQRYGGDGLIKDNLTYHYNERAPGAQKNNRLENIDDYATYHYNAIGQLTEEEKDSGSDQFIEFDVTGKVRKVFSDVAKTQLKVEFIYDDRGFRLAKVNHDPESPRTTWYIRDASGNVISTYEQEGLISYNGTGEPVLKTEPLDQKEVPVYGAGKLGTFYPGQDGSTAYEITDHLGNVRALIRDNISIYTATMEDNGQAEYTNPRVQEMAFFENLFETEKDDDNMNHTPGDVTIVSDPSRSAYLFWQDDVEGTEAEDKAIGPAAGLRVKPGDRIELETWARYRKEDDYTNSIPILMLSQLLGSTFSGSAGFEGASISQTASSFETALGNGGFDSDGTDETRPFAYLNFILFNDALQMVDAGWERVPLTAGFDSGEEGLANAHRKVRIEESIQVTETGYIYVWVSNESENVRVWFDDLQITHSEAIVVQATDYGVWGDVIREQKTDESVYRYGYQGQFAEKDEETGWSHFELREYDAVIGRWTAMDPYRQYWSPYTGMGNNPVSSIDPDGGWGGPGDDMDMAYSDAMQQMDYGLYDDIQMSGGGIMLGAVGVSPGYEWYQFFNDHNPGGDFLYEVNKLNPIAQVTNSISAYATGQDTYGVEMSNADATVSLATAIPIFKVAGTTANIGSKLLTQGIKALHKHHVLPQTYRAWFASRGIQNIDDYTVLISQSTHLKGVHGSGLGNLPGKWNDEWGSFIEANPNASPSAIFHQAEGMLQRFGLEHLPYVKY